MSCATLLVHLAVLGMPAEPIEAPNDQGILTLRELEAQVTDALRREAIATDGARREAAIRQLVAVDQELAVDRRIETSRTLKQLRMKLRARLRRVEKELARQTVSHSPGELSGARGGRAQQAPNNAQALIELIQATISPDSWDVNGGQSTIFYFAPRHALVVRAPAEVHSRTRRLLIDLR